MKYNVMIVGGGGREHALAWKISQSPLLARLYVAPGNAGTAEIAENVELKADDIKGLLAFAKEQNIDFTIVGPDDSLALGIVDLFQAEGLKIFGPTKAAAQIEASKAYAKELMSKAGVPTAEYQTFTDFEKAIEYIKTQNYPIFIKASGLALGKGAVGCSNFEEARQTLTDMMQNEAFGEAGKTVVVEAFLDGPEMSMHAFSDGSTFKMLPSSQDNKPINDGGQGPNTGGMGTIAPLPYVDQSTVNQYAQKVVNPILDALAEDGAQFTGLLYPGIKLSADGPKIVEYNARFGDPETQVYMRLLKSDLLEVLMACESGTLEEVRIEWDDRYAVCVIAASGGYPGTYEKGKAITGIEEAEKLDDVVIFHAGTKLIDRNLYTNGGRVLGVSAVGETLDDARKKAYEAMEVIHFEGMHYRTDIGKVER